MITSINPDATSAQLISAAQNFFPKVFDLIRRTVAVKVFTSAEYCTPKLNAIKVPNMKINLRKIFPSQKKLKAKVLSSTFKKFFVLSKLLSASRRREFLVAQLLLILSIQRSRAAAPQFRRAVFQLSFAPRRIQYP